MIAVCNMRAAWVFLFWALWRVPGVEAQQAPASIRGTVVHSITGAPLKGVHLRLESDEAEEVYGAMTNGAGEFSIAAIRPEVRYQLEAELPGFLLLPTIAQAPSGVIARTFHAGEHVNGYKLEMAPRVAISGRVVDENGEPATNAVVMFRRAPQAVPTHANAAGSGWPLPDDRGMFRLSVVPDKYYLLAVPARTSQEPPEIRTDGTADNPYLPTYYPSAANTEGATAIEARAGSDISGIVIRILRAPALHISGTLSGFPAGARDVEVVLAGEGRIIRAEDGKAGTFEFSKVLPGGYRVYAKCRAGDETLWSDGVDVNLTGSSADFLQLALLRGFELTGVVKGLPEARGGEDRIITLFPVREDWNNYDERRVDGTIAGDGTFRIGGLLAGVYEVQISEMDDDWYLKKLELGTREAADGVVDLKSGAPGTKLTVTIGTAGGRISGAITGKDGEVLRRVGSIYLIQDGKDVSPRHMRFEQTTEEGKFTIRGIAPGKYRIGATAYGITPVIANRAEALKEWATNMEAIEIHEAEQIVKNLNVQGAK